MTDIFSPLCNLLPLSADRPGETEASEQQSPVRSATAARLPGQLVSLLSFHCLLVTLHLSCSWLDCSRGLSVQSPIPLLQLLSLNYSNLAFTLTAPLELLSEGLQWPWCHKPGISRLLVLIPLDSSFIFLPPETFLDPPSGFTPASGRLCSPSLAVPLHLPDLLTLGSPHVHIWGLLFATATQCFGDFVRVPLVIRMLTTPNREPSAWTELLNSRLRGDSHLARPRGRQAGTSNLTCPSKGALNLFPEVSPSW